MTDASANHTTGNHVATADDAFAADVVALLSTAWLGRPLLFVHQVDSTNSRCAELARGGGQHGTVIVADQQTAGRGRLKRSWHSPGGENLYFSVLMRPDWPVGEAPPLSLAAGVALAEVVEGFLTRPPELKWPNDLLHQGRKLAGILIEAAADRGGLAYVVLGIGINVNQLEFPAPLDETAGSLRMAAGAPVNRAEVLAAALERLEHWIDRLRGEGAHPIIDAWRRFWTWQGRMVTVRNGDRELTGTAVGIDPRGALRLRDSTGNEHTVVCGDATTTQLTGDAE